eukprot:PITA_34492
MSAFRALYGYDALSFADVMFGDSKAPRAKDWIQESQDILRALKDNLQTVQNQQKLVTRRVGEVAYELELPPGSRVHNIFHVSCLKKAVGQQVAAATDLSPMDDEGHLVLESKAILDTRERHLWNRVIKGFFIRWRNLQDEDATWEGEKILQNPSLQLLEEKQCFGGEDYDIPT